jgi:hypothetical protein
VVERPGMSAARSLEDLLAMEHRERQLWIKEISTINKEINESRR